MIKKRCEINIVFLLLSHLHFVRWLLGFMVILVQQKTVGVAIIWKDGYRKETPMWL